MKFTCTILINGEKQHGNITVYKMKLIHVILTILNLYKMKTIQLSKEKITVIPSKNIQKPSKKPQKQPRPLHFHPKILKEYISPWEFTAKIKEIQNQDEYNWIRKHFFYKMKIIHITLHKLEEPPSSIKWNSSTQHAIVFECLVGNPSSIKWKAYNRTYSSIKW